MATQTELFGDLRPETPRPRARKQPVDIGAPLWTIDKSRLIRAGCGRGSHNPRLLDPGPTPLPPESKGNGLRLAGEPLVGLESAPMDALGRAGHVERLTIQPRKKTHECYSKGNRRPAK